MTYKSAGVDISANEHWVRRIQSTLSRTQGPQVISRPGAFAGLMRLNRGSPRSNHKRPVLVGCADGVGTKILLGIKARRIRGLGIDLVAMNVNDLITCGAQPLFFLDYLAVNKLNPDTCSALLDGMADGCKQAGCALLGGETAEMPDLYHRGHFDLAGFAVGVVDESRIIDPRRVKPGDVLIGLPSSGLHSNGFSLVRKLIDRRRISLSRTQADLGESPADALLRTTRIYVKPVRHVLRGRNMHACVTGMAHVTGGGLQENVARAIGKNCDAVIHTTSWTPLPVFHFLQEFGVSDQEMFRVFNMGIGFVIIVKPREATRVIRRLKSVREKPLVIGEVFRGTGNVILN